eukprot:UN16046
MIKLIKYGNKEVRDLICKKILNDVNGVSANRFGCMVLDRIVVHPESKNFRLLLLQQVYSKLYKELPEINEKGKAMSFEDIIKKSPEQKQFILGNMNNYLSNMLTKSPSLVFVQIVLAT